MERLKAQIIRHEGLRRLPYECSQGKMTIGVGRNIEDNGLRDDEIDLMLENDLKSSVAECNRNFSFFGALDEVRQDVLVNMCFNMGIGRLLGFRRMCAALERGDFDVAAREMMDSRWARQVKGRAKELAQQMKRGEYVSD